VKGKKSSCLQSETEQCLPRFGNSGVPIGIKLYPMQRRENEFSPSLSSPSEIENQI